MGKSALSASPHLAGCLSAMTDNLAKYDRWPFLRELEMAFDHFNNSLFDGALSMPVHVVRQDKKVVFRFLPDSHSLVIGSKFSSATQETILQEYLHEMIHMENSRRGEVDCTSNQYHNKRFLETALEKGFFVSKHEAQGWSKTRFSKPDSDSECKEPSTEAHEWLLSALRLITLDKQLIEEGQEEIARIITSSAPAKVCFLKYVCECDPPHNSIRSGRRPDGPNPLQIKCLVCKAKFTCVDESDPVKE